MICRTPLRCVPLALALVMGGGVARAQESGAVPPASAEDYQRALICLTQAVAYEAGNEPVAGQQAVAEVVLNRARHPAYPNSVCGVVYQGSHRRTGCQFTFTCDGSLRRRLSARLMDGAQAVARAALDGLNPAQALGATHYHADYVSPYWAPSLVRVRKIGAHIFYRAPSDGDMARLPGAYRPGAEPALARGAGAASGQETGAGGSVPRPAASPGIFAPWGLPASGG